MLIDLKLPSLKSRRRDRRLQFVYRVVEESVPAISLERFLLPQRSTTRCVQPKRSPVCVASNAVDRSATNNSTCLVVPEAYTGLFKNSCFVKTLPSGTS